MQHDPFEAERQRLQAAASERQNEIGSPPPDHLDAREIANQALQKQGPLLREADARTDRTASEARLADPNDPYSLLKLNLQSTKEEFVMPERRKSTRWRDYLLIMIPGNGALLLILGFQFDNPYVSVPAFAGIVLLSISTTWVIWVVMDREQFMTGDKLDKTK